jgi:hypothetical protein
MAVDCKREFEATGVQVRGLSCDQKRPIPQTFLKFSIPAGVNVKAGPSTESAMKSITYFISTILILVGVSGSVSTASAEAITLKADLKGSNEVPPNNSPASGEATATFNTETKALSWIIIFKDLTGPAVAAHFHGPGEPGKNAGIVLPFKSAQSPIEGTAVLSDAQVADLIAGKWYTNIHTAANPGGELRGQMVKQ